MRVYELRGEAGFRVEFIAIGGAITAIDAPDRAGRIANVALGHANPEAYRTQTVYLGAVVGRYANRIANARFALDGRTYRLEATDGTSCVHGGKRGFDKAEWRVEAGADVAVLSHVSPDGDEGFPGELKVTMTYRVEGRTLTIDYEATTDRPTLVNLTNHSYLNLAGEGAGDILGHVVEIPAARYTPSDADLIPTGAIDPVDGTPFDFRVGQPIGARIRVAHPQMLAGWGYDVNYCVGGEPGRAPVHAARVVDPVSGRRLDLSTTAPGMQVYTGNRLDGSLVGRSGRTYRQSDGFCLEPHHYPDTPNKPGFPSCRLDPGEVWRSRSVYAFGVAD